MLKLFFILLLTSSKLIIPTLKQTGVGRYIITNLNISMVEVKVQCGVEGHLYETKFITYPRASEELFFQSNWGGIVTNCNVVEAKKVQ